LLKPPPPVIIEDETVVAAEERKKKVVNFKVRTLWTFILLAGFFTILALGHMYVIALVTVIQIVVYKEVIALASVPAREKNIPFFKVLNWYLLSFCVLCVRYLMLRYFLATTMFFLYGESLIYYFKHIVFVDEYFLYFAIHHRFISSVLYLIGTSLSSQFATQRC
jgi:phosphatidate cytidylyltransferase